MKLLIWVGLFVGSALGGLIPALWGESFFSFSSVVLSTVGGVIGIYAGWKAGRAIGM